MNFRYDPEAQAMYIRISPEFVHATQSINEEINADVDRLGRIVGLEFLNITEKPYVR